MDYYDAMLSKFGFSYGDAVPPDAEARRTVYVKTINRIAELRGSAVRAVAYDRPGMHNWCMICYASAKDVVGYGERIVARDLDLDEVAPDEAMQDAIEMATEIEIDQFVIVETRIDESFETMLAGLPGDVADYFTEEPV